MPVPESFELCINTKYLLEWVVTDEQTGLPVNDATVTATLYRNRSRTDPDHFPGTAQAGFTNVSVAYVASSRGVYQALIPPYAFTPGNLYVTVIDVLLNGESRPSRWEIKTVVKPRTNQ